MTALSAVLVFMAGMVVRVLLVALFVAALGLPILAALQVWVWGRTLFAGGKARHDLAGFAWEGGRFFAPTHTWLQPVNGRLRVGLDGLAQRLLQEVRFVKLPEPGTTVAAGQVAAEVQCADHTVQVVAPVTGTVAAVNDNLCREPRQIQADPYQSGWLFTVTPRDTGFRALPWGRHAKDWFRAEAARFERALEHELGVAAADGGGHLVSAAPALTREQWDSLVRQFLSTNR